MFSLLSVAPIVTPHFSKQRLPPLTNSCGSSRRSGTRHADEAGKCGLLMRSPGQYPDARILLSRAREWRNCHAETFVIYENRSPISI